MMLLDGDAAGKKMAKDLQNGLYQGAKGRILLTNSYAGFENSEVEDLLPAEFLANVIDRWGRRAETPFEDVVKTGSPIVPQIEAWAKSEGLDLYEGWKVDIAREAKRKALAPTFTFPADTLLLWKKLFDDLLGGGAETKKAIN